MDKEKLIEIRNISVTYTTERAVSHALNDFNLDVHVGESIGLVGESGAGKTTAALSILNLLPKPVGKITNGDILYKGKSVLRMKPKELEDLRGDRIAMIFQNPLTSLNPTFTVGEQIAMVLRRHRGMMPREALVEAGHLLETVGILASRVSDYPHQFSGGMRQRVGIAAGLACNPELLIADEPTTALDVTIQAQILELMKELQKKYSTSLLMITHNLGIISELCEKVAVVYGGSIIEYGTVREVFKNPLHPYTVGLLGALPKLDSQSERLTAIPGNIANSAHLPDGCRFHPRCELCMRQCEQQLPQLVQIDAEHYVACHHKLEA